MKSMEFTKTKLVLQDSIWRRKRLKKRASEEDSIWRRERLKIIRSCLPEADVIRIWRSSEAGVYQSLKTGSLS